MNTRDFSQLSALVDIFKSLLYNLSADYLQDVNNRKNSKCEECKKYKSRYIEYPLTINGIENAKIETKGIRYECGTLCEVVPCGEEYGGKSYIGIYIGDLPISITTSLDEKTCILKNSTFNNPAIFVPELKRIVYGCGSWWRAIRSLEDFKGISEEDINDTWYVKLLREIN